MFISITKQLQNYHSYTLSECSADDNCSDDYDDDSVKSNYRIYTLNSADADDNFAKYKGRNENFRHG